MITPRDAIEAQIDMQIRDCCRNGELPQIPVALFTANEKLRNELLADYMLAGWKIDLVRKDTWYQFSVAATE